MSPPRHNHHVVTMPPWHIASREAIAGTMAYEAIRVPSVSLAQKNRELLILLCMSHFDYVGGVRLLSEACCGLYYRSVDHGQSHDAAVEACHNFRLRALEWMQDMEAGHIGSEPLVYGDGVLNNRELYRMSAVTAEAADIVSLALKSLRRRLPRGDPHFVPIQDSLLTFRAFAQIRIHHPVPSDTKWIPESMRKLLEDRAFSEATAMDTAEDVDPVITADEVVPELVVVPHYNAIPKVEYLEHQASLIKKGDEVSEKDKIRLFHYIYIRYALERRLIVANSKLLLPENGLKVLSELFFWTLDHLNHLASDLYRGPRIVHGEALYLRSVIGQNLQILQVPATRTLGINGYHNAFSRAADNGYVAGLALHGDSIQDPNPRRAIAAWEAGSQRGDMLCQLRSAERLFDGKYEVKQDRLRALAEMRSIEPYTSITTSAIPFTLMQSLQKMVSLGHDVTSSLPPGINYGSECRRLSRRGAQFGYAEAIMHLERTHLKEEEDLLRVWLGLKPRDENQFVFPDLAQATDTVVTRPRPAHYEHRSRMHYPDQIPRDDKDPCFWNPFIFP